MQSFLELGVSTRVAQALAERDIQMLGQPDQHLTTRQRPAGLDEREVAGRDIGTAPARRDDPRLEQRVNVSSLVGTALA